MRINDDEPPTDEPVYDTSLSTVKEATQLPLPESTFGSDSSDDSTEDITEV